MKKNLEIKKDQGFTIIETMISIALFLIVVTIGMGALMQASEVHKKSQNMRSVMDNLSFIMDDMSRNLRTGSSYVCTGGTGAPSPDCTDGTEISFNSSDGVTQLKYLIDLNNDIIQKTTNNDTPVTLSPSSDIILGQGSGFTVIGATPASAGTGDTQQPFVTIRLVGTITDHNTNNTTSFSLQTSVSQRFLDR